MTTLALNILNFCMTKIYAAGSTCFQEFNVDILFSMVCGDKAQQIYD